MNAAKDELTRSWLVKAKRDLLSAPEADEYREAFDAAVKVFHFVLQKLPSVVHP